MRGINFAKMKIMVVEDHDPTRETLETLLLGSGAKMVVAVAEAGSALGHLQDERFDILIADINLGASSGLALVKAIRRNPGQTNRYMPIIMLTGDTRMATVEKAGKLGVNFFLSKPLDVERLLKTITSLMERPSVFIHTKDYFGPERSNTERGSTERGSAEPAAKRPKRALRSIEGTRVVWT